MSMAHALPIQRGFALVTALALILGAMVPLAAPRPAKAAPSDVFFSEYVEGSSFNKALEIYNGTGTSIDLAAGIYTVQMYFNGNSTAGTTVHLSGTVASGDVYVLAHSSAAPSITAQADQTNGASWYNGDDAVVLLKAGEMLDVIGQIGFDPGSQWGSGDTSTADNTLRRKAGIEAGDTNGTDAFDPSVEWDGFAQDSFDGLGSHASTPPTVTPVINEFVANHTGTDTNEYVEIRGPAGTDLSSLAVLQLEGDTTGAGTLDTVFPVGTTSADGYWHTGLLTNALENGTITLLLVEGFDGSTGTDLDTDNDGTLDVMPWTSILDAVAVTDGGAGDLTYGTPVLAPGYDGFTFTPGGASRIPDGSDTDAPSDWMRNDFDLAGLDGATGTPEAGEALNTPGAPNQAFEEPSPVDGLVISQVYGGGGNSGATLRNDFIELFNGSGAPVSLDGWSVQYARFDGSSWQATPLSGTLEAGRYYLVQEAAGTGGTAALPTPDAIGSIPLSATNGKVALVSTSGPLAGTCPLEDSVDFVGYGPSANCFEGSGPTEVLANTTAALRNGGGLVDTDDNAADFHVGAPAPRNSASPPPSTGGSCGDEATFIHGVQGTGAISPMIGQSVEIEGIVTGDFQNNEEPDDGTLNGFYVQEVHEESAGVAGASEGLFIHAAATDVSVGDHVRVAGTVVEFTLDGSQMTQLTDITGVSVCEGGLPLPEAIVLTMPVTDLEPYEGMLVTFPEKLTISEYFNFDRFGEVVLTKGRQFQPTAVHEPGSAAAAQLAEENRTQRITLDDGQSAQNPDPAIHPNGNVFDLHNRFRGGDTVEHVTGVIDDTFGVYRIQPTEAPDYVAVNHRPEAPDDVGGSLTVASFNVLNYFTTIDDGTNDICGPAADQECRGADDEEELLRQRTKIIAALAQIDADVVGLIEIENHPADDPTADLVDGLNEALGPGTYDYVETGAIGTDAIRVALIYKPGSVSPVGEHAILDSDVDERFDDDRNRPVLAQAFEETATDGVFTVAVNHLKSKGSACEGDFDPEQGNCNMVRTRAAEALVDWLAGDPTGSGDVDALIMGDLNAYDKEDPIDAIRDGGYTDLVDQYGGEYAYSYLFGAQLGYLDHALASATLTSQVTGATVWHVNADEPDILDYDTSFKQEAQADLWEANAYRSSDHDPVIVGLDLLSYGFDGLEPPIGEDNVARAGSTVPVKFALDDELDLDDVLLEPAQVYACGEWPSGDHDDAVAAGGTEFRYDPLADQYVFTWKTDPDWAGECVALVVTLRDGSYAIAEFEFG